MPARAQQERTILFGLIRIVARVKMPFIVNLHRAKAALMRLFRRACALAACVSTCLWCVLVTSPAAAQSVPKVAAASSLNFALPEIAAQFTRDTGERVDVVFGASGALTRQIQEGAPFELFLAADEDFPRRLAAAGLTEGEGAVYAVGRLVLFAPNGSPLTVDGQLRGLSALIQSNGVSRFAIANPSVAPYGKAAESVLRRRGLWDRLQSRLVLGDTIAQAAQFATTGNAVGGLVAYSLVRSPQLAARGAFALIDSSEHEPLRQRMVLLKRATPTAQRFFDYLRGPKARPILERFGFSVPQ